MLLLVLPSSISELLKKVLPPLDRRDGADLILMGEGNDIIVAYVAWFEDRFWVFIPPFFYLVLRAATVVVGFALLPARSEDDFEVVSGELLRLSHLSPIPHLCCLE